MENSRENISKLQSITAPNSVRQRRRNDIRSRTLAQRRKADSSRKTTRKLIKVGMAVSLTSLVLSGFRVVKLIAPLHPLLGVTFVVFTVLHLVHYNRINHHRINHQDTHI